jgi:DNA-binding transcriptional LysR family regulator
MPPSIDWESQLGRRIRLRDLHVFTTSVRLGSMAKAAKELGVSQPAVSEVIAGLEHALGVRLLDRTPYGVEPTPYGSALLRRSIAAFDELRQGIRDIEFLADPTGGELRIGCPESIAAAYLQSIIALFTQSHPHVVLDIDTINTLSFSPKLRERTLDLVLARAGWPLDEPSLVEDLTIEPLFDDHLVVAVGESHPLARRRKPNWADLADESWVLTRSDSWNYQLIAEAFNARGLKPPKVCMRTLSVHLRANLAATGRCVTTFPRSVLLLHGQHLGLKVLPIDLPPRTWPILAVTLRDRTLSPIVERFLTCARTVSRSLSKSQPRQTTVTRRV